VIRKAVLLLTMVVGISLVLWAGWHNLRERRRVMQLQEQARVDLLPGAGEAGSAGKGASDGGSLAEEGASLRGKPAPAFTLDDLAGKKVSLSDFKGRPLVVNFWGTYCDPCKIEMPWLEEFQKKYAADGLEVVGVTYDAEVGKEKIGKDVQRLGVTYPILLSDAEVEKSYLKDSEVLPMSFYVDKAGKVVDVSAGLGQKDELEAMVKETIAAGDR
jgi:thiol-disulfide isomerase/thioredoxin